MLLCTRSSIVLLCTMVWIAVTNPLFAQQNQGYSKPSGGWLQILDNESLKLDVFTLECWLLPQDRIVIVSRDRPGIVAPDWSLVYDASRGRLEYMSSAFAPDEYFQSPVNSLPRGTWAHLAVVVDGDSGRVDAWINGVKSLSVSLMPRSFTVRTGLAWGGYFGNPLGASGSALLDECRYWKGRRTETQIRTWMDTSLPKGERGVDLHGYWMFCDNYADSSLYGNHLIPTGSANSIVPVTVLPNSINCQPPDVIVRVLDGMGASVSVEACSSMRDTLIDVCIRSIGGHPATIHRVELTGVDPEKFEILHPSIPPDTTIHPAQQICLRLRCMIDFAGEHAAVLRVTYDGTRDSVLLIPLRITKDSASLLLSSLDFGVVDEQDLPVRRPLRIHNKGFVPFTITRGVFSATSPFLLLTPLPVTLQPGQFVDLDIVFTRVDTTGFLADTLVLDVDVACLLRRVLVSGTINPKPPVAIDFPFQLCDGTGARDTLIWLRNSTSVVLTPMSVRFTGLSASSFAVVSPPFPSAALAPGDSVAMVVRYNPQETGSHSAALDVFDQIPKARWQMVLSGRHERARIEASTLDFGPWDGASLPVIRAVTIRNTGSISQTITSLVFPPSSPFISVTSLPVTILPGDSATVQIRFSKPDSAGLYRGVFTIISDPQCETFTTEVTGSMKPVHVSTMRAHFTVGPCDSIVSSDVSIRIFNEAATTQTLTRARVTGPDSAAFEILPPDIDGVTIEPADSLALYLRYTPPAPGRHSATLYLQSREGGQTWVIELEAESQFMHLDVPHLSFGRVDSSAFPVDKAIRIYNSGTTNVVIDSLSLPKGTWFELITSMPVVLMPGQGVDLHVRFHKPMQAGVVVDSFVLWTRPWCSAVYLIVDGERLDDGGITSVRDIDFPTVPCMLQVRDTMIVVTNTGKSAVGVSGGRIEGDSAFLLLSSFPRLLPGAGSDTIRIRYSPQGYGSHSATLILEVDAQSQQELRIDLHGQTPLAALLCDSLDFGDVGSFPAVASTVIVNVGTMPVRLDSLGFKAYDPFTLITPMPVVIAPGDSVRLQIQFADPGSNLPFVHAATLFHYPWCDTTTLVVAGRRRDVNALSAPREVHVDIAPCLTGEIDTVVYVENAGNGAVRITDVSFEGDPRVHFSTHVLPITLPPGDRLPLRLTIDATGTRDAYRTESMVKVKSDAGLDSLIAVRIVINYHAAALTVSPVDFGVLFSDSLPLTRTIMLVNSGSVPMRVHDVDLGLGSVFDIIAGLPVTLSPNDTARVLIRFFPTRSDSSYAEDAAIIASPLCEPVHLRVSGEYAQARIIIELPELRARPGERVTMPITVHHVGRTGLAGVSALGGMLKMSRSLLAPNFNAQQLFRGRDMLINLMLGVDAGIYEYEFTATLGIDSTTLLSFDSFTLTSIHPVEVTQYPGRFTLDGICHEGGDRFVDADAVVSLNQNHPNPFNPVTTIDYSIIEEGHVSMIVYDASGRVSATLVDAYRHPGRYSVVFDARHLSSGIYHCVLRSGMTHRSIALHLLH